MSINQGSLFFFVVVILVMDFDYHVQVGGEISTTKLIGFIILGGVVLLIIVAVIAVSVKAAKKAQDGELVPIEEGEGEDYSTKFLIQHKSSGKCLAPFGGSTNPDDNTSIVYSDDCTIKRGPAIQYKITPNGQISQVSSGKCLIPSTGTDNPGDYTGLTLRSNCIDNQSMMRFKILPNGQIQHVSSGKCLLPAGGTNNPVNDTSVVFYNNCADEAGDIIRYRRLAVIQ